MYIILYITCIICTCSSFFYILTGFDFAAASAKITTNYVELTQLPINSILGALWAKKVILPRQKEEIEAIPLQSNRMEYLIDSVINPSLNVIKFKGLLEVMEQSEDVMFKSMAQNLVCVDNHDR